MKRVLTSIILLLGVISSYGQTDSSLQMFQMYYDLASDASKYENYESALSWYQKSLDYAKSNFGENNILVATALSEIGKTQIKMGNKDDGVNNLKECVRIGRLLDNYNPATIVFLMSDLADGYRDCSQYDNALRSYKEALKELQKWRKCSTENEDINLWHTSILRSIGETYFLMHQYRKAAGYYNESNEILSNYLPEDLSLLIDRQVMRWQNRFVGESNYQDYFYQILMLNTQSLFDSNISLCRHYVENNSHNKAIYYFDKAINIALQNKNIMFGDIDDALVVSLLSHTAQSERGAYIDRLSTFRQQLTETAAKYNNKKPDNLCHEISIGYWIIAHEICEKLNEIEIGTQYIYKHVDIFRERNVIDLNYAHAMSSCAYWQQEVVGDIKGALYWHHQRVNLIGNISSIDNDLFKTAISDMRACYGVHQGTKYLTEMGKGMAIADYIDVIAIMDYWADILKDLYKNYGQKHIDDLLIKDCGNNSYWYSDTYIATFVEKFEILLQSRQKEPAMQLARELLEWIKDRDLKVLTNIKLADLLRRYDEYIEAKDMYEWIIHSLTEFSEPYKYKREIEYCITQLANLLAVRLGDIDRAMSLLTLNQIFADGPHYGYNDIANYIYDQHTWSEICAQLGQFEESLVHKLNAYDAFDQNRSSVSDTRISECYLLSDIGKKYRILDQYEESEGYLRKALDLYNKEHNAENQANALNLYWPRPIYFELANLYFDKKEWDKAKDIFLQVYTYDCKYYPGFVSSPASYLAQIYLECKDYTQFEKYWDIYWGSELSRVNRDFATMTNEERSTYASKSPFYTNILAGTALQFSPYYNKYLYNSVLLSKGLLLNAEKSISTIVHNSKNGSLITAYTKYKDALRLNDPNQYMFEKEFMYLYKKVTSKPIIEIYDWMDIRFSLDRKTIAIEFIESWGNEGDNYVALMLRKGWDAPRLVELCAKSDIERYKPFDSSSIQSNEKNPYKGYKSKQLYKLIWSKLEPFINEGDNVYFAPDGLLYQMNIEVLHDDNGRRPNEKWNLHRVSSTRELCMGKPKININSATLYGGLIYEMRDEDLIAQSRTYTRGNNVVITRSFTADSTMRVGWKYLGQTKDEIDAIAELCQAHRIKTDRYIAMAGNEESFKALSGRMVPIIHLATHGFFFKNEDVEDKKFFETKNLDQCPNKLDNSLKRSGLILAGGQKAWLGGVVPDNVEDGILLAEEIAAMDLTGTDLVVLSACETGLGEITSEGVFGLQRAFKKAGVQTLIMSLWKVDDGATSLFMQTFYKHWLEGKTKHEAFAAAQKTVREKEDYSNPYYWAGFIMLD